MEILANDKERVTVVLKDDEVSLIAEACFELVKHPTSTGGNYETSIGSLRGEFDMLAQLRELAKKQQEGAAQ